METIVRQRFYTSQNFWIFKKGEFTHALLQNNSKENLLQNNLSFQKCLVIHFPIYQCHVRFWLIV